MRVLKEPEKFSKQVSCSCGALLEIEADDLKYYPGSSTSWGCAECYFVVCPCCDQDINWYVPVDGNDIPEYIQAQARDRYAVGR